MFSPDAPLRLRQGGKQHPFWEKCGSESHIFPKKTGKGPSCSQNMCSQSTCFVNKTKTSTTLPQANRAVHPGKCLI